MSRTQCSRPGAYAYRLLDGTEVLFCRQHHPDSITAREAEREAKRAAERDAQRARSAYLAQRARLRIALYHELARAGDSVPRRVREAYADVVAHADEMGGRQ